MILLEMIRAAFELRLRHPAVELIVEQEIFIEFEPALANQVGSSAHRLIRIQLILLPQLSILLELFV